MPYCPKCHDEFQDWVKACPDCGVSLVDRLPPPPTKQERKANKLVTVATFSRAEEAHVSKGKLQSEGIWSFVADEHIVTTNWLYSIAVGGVKLQVKESDAEKAYQFLQYRQGKVTRYVEHATENCPKCGSSDVHYATFSLRPLFISWLILGFPLPFLKRKWVCTKCGHKWR